MSDEIKAILIQNGEPTPGNPIEIKRLLVNKEAEDYITNLQTIEQQYSAILSENAELQRKVNNQKKEINRLVEQRKKFMKKHGYLQQENQDYQSRLNVLNHIVNNLQEKINQYENPDDLTLFYMWLDEKAKDKMKELQDEIQNFRGSLKTYEILLKTNVEENERLKELCNKYEEEHNTKFNEWVFDKRENEELINQRNSMACLVNDIQEELDDYKSRCEKGIAICDEMLKVLYDYTDRKVFKDIKDTLTGGDKE